MVRRLRSPRLLVLGDLVIDVVLAPARPLALGTDVPGRVQLRPGGSAASTARWLARLGAHSTLVTAVGRDREGRALVDDLRRAGVRVHARSVAGLRTGRIGVLLSPRGERSFVADRAAADHLRPEDLRASWFAGQGALHLPLYSLLGQLGRAGRRAIALARSAAVPVSLDLSSVGPLLLRGRRHARALVHAARPDLLFATAAEAQALLGRRPLEDLLSFCRAVLLKRGPAGPLILLDDGRPRRIAIPAARLDARDTTGAGDAFAAGALRVWASAPAALRRHPSLLRRAALTGHRTAAHQLRAARGELIIR
jgi:sugar/nucleoside kinase (ribokinase family)